MSEAPAGSDWHACHTRPRREKRFAALMAAEGLEHYLPLVPSVRRYPSGTKRFTKPLFPGYVFARIPAAARPRIYQQELVARAIRVDDEAKFLAQIEDVRRIVASGAELSLIPFLTRGRSVRVVGGPLHGLEGLVDDSSDPRGVVISVDVLRQGLRLTLPAESLRAMP